MGVDTFICGDCNEKFYEINQFVAHKNAGCATIPKEESAGEEPKEEMHVEIIPEQTETVGVEQSVKGEENKEQVVVSNTSDDTEVSATVVEMVDDATVSL